MLLSQYDTWMHTTISDKAFSYRPCLTIAFTIIINEKRATEYHTSDRCSFLYTKPWTPTYTKNYSVEGGALNCLTAITLSDSRQHFVSTNVSYLNKETWRRDKDSKAAQNADTLVRLSLSSDIFFTIWSALACFTQLLVSCVSSASWPVWLSLYTLSCMHNTRSTHTSPLWWWWGIYGTMRNNITVAANIAVRNDDLIFLKFAKRHANNQDSICVYPISHFSQWSHAGILTQDFVQERRLKAWVNTDVRPPA